jgi:hypothetical protein
MVFALLNMHIQYESNCFKPDMKNNVNYYTECLRIVLYSTTLVGRLRVTEFTERPTRCRNSSLSFLPRQQAVAMIQFAVFYSLRCDNNCADSWC